MSRFSANGTNIDPTLLLINIVKDAENPHTKLPDWRNRFKRRHKIVQEFPLPRLSTGRMSQLRCDGLREQPPIMRAESLQVFLDALRKQEVKPRHAYTIA